MNLEIKKIKEIIPSECFVKKPLLGTTYIVTDFALWAITTTCYYFSSRNIICKILYWLTSGFFMWCQFMNGHDCGHGSFSNSEILNNIMGHISHTPLLVPFSTWAESHRRHHVGHNHIKRDYSHPHVINRDRKIWFAKVLQYAGVYPIFGWFIYMTGIVDGGHWIPIGGKLWNNEYSLSKQLHSVLSSGFVFIWFSFILSLCKYNFWLFMEWYGMSWFVFSWWIITVTYLQHNDNSVEETIVYGDKSWTFVKGALQTVDRSYGSIIDKLTHNITNCHLVHHIFFHNIPHYHLNKATKHLYKYLDKNGVKYKYRYTPFFFLDIFKYTITHLNEAKLEK
jgi:acyl-lipid omega-3 desaturase